MTDDRGPSRAPALPPGALIALRAIVGRDALLVSVSSRVAYESDALAHRRGTAAAVVLPSSAEQVRRVVAACREYGIPFVARGHGTGLSGGSIPCDGGLVIALGRLNRILSVDAPSRIAVVEPGVTTAAVTRAAAPHGLFFAPDPSSGEVCSIGGNIAENAGGAHCLKYGTTTNHVLGLKVVLPDARLITLGGPAPNMPGSEVLPLFVGSEGTLGIVVEATLRLTARPEAVVLLLAMFSSMVAAADVVSAIISAGIVPAAMEAMDRLSIRAGEPIAHAGLPDVDAALFIELDGPSAEVAAHALAVEGLCRSSGASEIRTAYDAEERTALWKARKGAVAGMGRVSPAYLLQDGVVPRGRLPEALARITDISRSTGLPIANVFHAGDGNLHPLICYDPASPGGLERAEAAAHAVTQVCLELGGSISGEHGIGLDKRDALREMLSPDELETQGWIRAAFDPRRLANPDKLLDHRDPPTQVAASRRSSPDGPGWSA